MDTFKKYLSALNSDERIVFAANCGVAWRHLLNVSYGYRKAGESLCIKIERESQGAVRCEDLRPDVDWAYLRQSKETANAQ